MTWLDELVSFSKGQLDGRAREALWSRGVTDEQAEAYHLGYLDRQLPELDYPGAFVEWSLGGSKLDDVFVLPLTNTLGDVRGVQFRHVERGRRGYMDYYADKSEAVFFGLAQAMPHVWETGEVYLVEGAFDLFPIQRIVPGTLATLTAHVSDPLLRVLSRLCSKIRLGYDMDSAGRRASHKFQREHGREFEVQIVSYPQVAMPNGELTKDPGELWEAWGDARLREALLSVLRSSNGLE